MSDNKKNFRDDLNDMIDHAKDEVKKAAERVSEKAGDFVEEAKEAFEETKEKASGFAETANEFTSEAKDAYNKASGDNKKVLAGILAILLGGFGIHKFILGYNKEGFILLALTIVLSVFSFGFFGWVVWIFTIMEGIIYLTKSDEEFYNTYQASHKPWF